MNQPPAPSGATAWTEPPTRKLPNGGAVSTNGHAPAIAPVPSNATELPVRTANRHQAAAYSALPGPSASGSRTAVVAHAGAGTAATCARAEPAATNGSDSATSAANSDGNHRRHRPTRRRGRANTRSPAR